MTDEQSEERPAEEDDLGAILVDLHTGETTDLGSFDSPMVTIGRSKTSNIRIEKERVSRVHATITKRPPFYELRDQRSHNGTSIGFLPFPEMNGRIQCEPDKGYQLRHGDLLYIGGVTAFEFRVLGGKVPTQI